MKQLKHFLLGIGFILAYTLLAATVICVVYYGFMYFPWVTGIAFIAMLVFPFIVALGEMVEELYL